MVANNNNINNINNIITTNKNKLQIASEQSVINFDSVKELKADKISHCHQDLPKDWQWAKLDLFNNVERQHRETEIECYDMQEQSTQTSEGVVEYGMATLQKKLN